MLISERYDESFIAMTLEMFDKDQDLEHFFKPALSVADDVMDVDAVKLKSGRRAKIKLWNA